MPMGPGEIGRLSKLLEEIRADRGACEALVERARGALRSKPWTEDAPVLAVVAVTLHHAYGAAEMIFERVARAFEGLPDQGDRWHRDLLEQMALDLRDIRPAVLRRETVAALAPVLGFRHFFRHAYAVAFDPRRLRLAAEDLLAAAPMLGEDLDAFEGTLRDAITALAKA